jgi:hypothetical protein
MSEPWRLRPNEVAGTRDVDAINAVMREALGDDWASVFIPTGRVRPMLWSDYFMPDAPALGFYAEPIIGAEVMPDDAPPVVTTPDPVADLVKAYKLINDAPLGVDRPPAGPWHRFEASRTIDVEDTINAPDPHGLVQDTLAALTDEAWGKLKVAADLARRSGCALCVHDGPTSMIEEPFDLERDQYRMRVRVRAHMLWPGQQCAHLPRTEYRDPT